MQFRLHGRLALIIPAVNHEVLDRHLVHLQDAQAISRLVEAEDADIVCLQVSVVPQLLAQLVLLLHPSKSPELDVCRAGNKAEGQRCGGLREDPAPHAARLALLLEQLDREEGLFRCGHILQVSPHRAFVQNENETCMVAQAGYVLLSTFGIADSTLQQQWFFHSAAAPVIC